MSAIPPRKPWPACWIHCQFCGVGRCLAFGYNSIFMPMGKKLRALIKLGWDVVPALKCPNCKKWNATEKVKPL